jgi:RNA polymerase sigma-70 factor (ECF subfamily)
VGLAFTAALQHLPPRQRAALVLREVLGYRTSEVAEMLDTSEASVKGALQRARATLDERAPAGGHERAPLPGSARERELVAWFATAVEQGDTNGLISLLTDSAWLTMPPQPYEYQGPEAIAGFIHQRGELHGKLRLLPTRANGQPAFGCYLPDPQAAVSRAYGTMVLTLAEDKVAAITWFGERSLLQHFGLPRTLPD